MEGGMPSRNLEQPCRWSRARNALLCPEKRETGKCPDFSLLPKLQSPVKPRQKPVARGLGNTACRRKAGMDQKAQDNDQSRHQGTNTPQLYSHDGETRCLTQGPPWASVVSAYF